MPHWLTFSLSCPWLTAFSAVALFATADTGTGAAPSVRPYVTVTLEIAGEDYRQFLTPRALRDTVLLLMQDSLRTLLEKNFGFLEWRERSDPVDTLRVRWIQDTTELADGQLQLMLHGPTVGVETLPPLLLDRWADMQARVWQPKRVSQEWSATIDSLFKRQREDIVRHLFGRMPLKLAPLASKVQVMPDRLKAVIGLRSDEIRAVHSPKTEFLIKLEVKDTVPPGSLGEGELQVGGCGRTLDRRGHVCEILGFTHNDRPIEKTRLREVLLPLVLLPRSVHLLSYQGSTVAVGPGGTVTP